MALFSIFNRRENNEPAARPLPPADAGEPPAPPPVHPELVEGPPLILLTADAAGPSVRRIHTFPDAECAAAHIQFWFPVSERGSVIAFWALPQQPASPLAGVPNGGAESACAIADSAPPLDVEAVVLVRHPEHSESVYPFSFTDVETANRFIRQETKRGLDLRAVHVYWAAFASIELGSGGSVAITPATPPAPAVLPVPETAVEPPERARPTLSASPGAPDPIASYAPPPEPVTLNDVIRELAAVLNAGRPSASAFKGFGSPAGRF